ncbi:hypothetical protein UFOVP144_19 [uncultured Caudovirales phage]|uniref:Uncharacterized protein n=1 Tax=uncultured Caudovirales phage TaxID=2100421 RepID=A0A6J7XM38_9CAUD|nr:hypothetical protein UFOVP144_19 [uncultured Caudovirales phage]
MNKLLDPMRVRQMMAAMQPQVEIEQPIKEVPSVVRAYEMVIKSKCALSDAAKSWKVKVSAIINYAKRNKLPLKSNAHDFDTQARQIVNSKSFSKIKPGLKTRVTYLLALECGISEACKITGASRRGVYYYCKQYDLPTPLRHIK